MTREIPHDARGCYQRRHHPRWREVRDELQYGYADLQPCAAVDPHSDRCRSEAPGLPRERVAVVVRLMEPSIFRHRVALWDPNH